MPEEKKTPTMQEAVLTVALRCIDDHNRTLARSYPVNLYPFSGRVIAVMQAARVNLERLKEEVAETDFWRQIALQLYDRERCRYDHNELCQTHSLHQRPCPHELIKEREHPYDR